MILFRQVHQILLDSIRMINIIRENSEINPQLTSFPAANANIAIFGTQSSGKSSLLNSIFGTRFPVLDTSITRQRCTRGVWFHNISKFNVIDTEGFDSQQRGPQQRILEKQIALFCLALSDILIINLWMNEIGRYEASHSHILKAVIKASERVIASQQRKIIFVVRDCTDDADRTIIKEQLSSQMMSIVKAETQKSTLKFSFDYFMMSHFYQKQAEFKKQAKELLKIISVPRKSNLSNYTDDDRLVYVKKLWEKVTSSQSEIDLRTVEDTLRNYALERIKRQTMTHMQEWLDNVENLSKYSTYLRFKDAAKKEVREYYMAFKPKHIKDKDIEVYIQAIEDVIDSKNNKYFTNLLLPQEEDRLANEEYQAKLDAIEKKSASEFKKQLEKRRKYVEDIYQGIVKGLKDNDKMYKRFIDKIESKNSKYSYFIDHLQKIFKIQLETAINQEVDKQTKSLEFKESNIKKIIKIFEEKHNCDSQSYIPEIWNTVIERTSNSTIIDRIKSEADAFTTVSFNFLIGNQTENILAHYRQLQAKAETYISNILKFNNENEDLPVNLQKLQNIRRLITDIIDKRLVQQSKRFKITLAFATILMFFFFSEFKGILKVLGFSKKKLKRWVWLYVCVMIGSIGILGCRNREYFKKFIQPQ